MEIRIKAYIVLDLEELRVLSRPTSMYATNCSDGCVYIKLSGSPEHQAPKSAEESRMRQGGL